MPGSVDKPLVTIAIPTYNSANRFLGDTIASALAQTYQNLEFIVSDNYSQDNTEELVERFTDPRLTYVRHTTNLGHNGNFNYCLDAASGTYLLLLHDDDLIDPDFVESCMQHARHSSSHSMIRTGTRIINGQGEVIREYPNIVNSPTPEALYSAWCSGATPWYFCSTLFNTVAVRDVGGFHSLHNLLEDAYVIVKLAPRCDWVDVRAVKSSTRITPEKRALTTPVDEWCTDYLALLDLMSEQVGEDVQAFRADMKHCFAERCQRRAKSQATRLGRVKAATMVARKFGLQYFPWKRLRRFGPLKWL